MDSRAKVVIEQEENRLLDKGRIQKRVVLVNEGRETAVQAGVELLESDYWMLGNDNYITLLPGERRELEFLLTPSVPGVFECGGRRGNNHGICVRWLKRGGTI